MDSSGKCATARRKAINKGSPCASNKDCMTTTAEPGNCVPSLINDKKYCAPLEADNEWQDALSAVFIRDSVVQGILRKGGEATEV